MTGFPLGATQTLTEGIPTDSANPLEWEDPRVKQAEEMGKWRRQSTESLDSALLDWEGYSRGKDIDLSYGMGDVEGARKRGLVATYLRIANNGQEVGGGDLGPGLMRDQIAMQRFGGRGVGSDEAFYTEIHKEATQRKQKGEIYTELGKNAYSSVAVALSDPDKENPFSWEAFYQEAKKKPGYRPQDDTELRIAWDNAREEVAQRIEPFQEEIEQIWQVMKKGGAGTLSEVLKESGDPVNVVQTAIKAGVESMREDSAATAFRLYKDIDPEMRGEFLEALGVLAQTFPKEEQQGFFNNLVKQGGRAVDDFGANIDSMPDTELSADTASALGLPVESSLPFMVQKEPFDAQLERRNFVDKVRKIERGEFSPIKYLSEKESAWRIAEEGAYGVPGALFTSAVAAVPYFGPGLVYSSMQGDAYTQVRDNLVAGGMKELEASKRAAAWSPIIALPNAALEKLQSKAILGQLPVFESTMRAIGDKISNVAVRGAVRTGVGAAEESLIELGQDYMASAVQDIASALDQDVPDVVWKNGKDGVLDGFWTDYATTMVTMLPLAVFGAAGGVSNDQRVRAFSEASDAQMLALGAKPEDIGVFRAESAKGLDSGTAALEAMINNLDPQSPTAKAATEAMIAEQDAANEAARVAMDSGAFPTITKTPEGWTVTDRETNTQYGPVATSDEAVQLATSNFSALKNATDNQLSYYQSMLDAVEESSALDKKGSTTTTLDLGLRMTPQILEATSPQAAEDLRLQMEAMEKAGELTPGLARVVYGVSQTDFMRGQRETTNKLYQGSSVATVFHEYFHGIRREAFREGRITPAEELEFLWEMDSAFKASKNKRGLKLGLLPDGVTKDKVTEKMRDEAISKIAEAEVLRARQGGKSGQSRENTMGLSSGFITRNIRALAKRGFKSAKKFSDLFEAVRGYFGLSMGRAVLLRQMKREGNLTAKNYEEYLSKLIGLSEQDMIDRKSKEVSEDIAGDSSFSVGEEIINPLISNSVDRIKDPKQKAAAFQRLIDKLNDLRKSIAERGVAFGQEQFSGTEHEAALAVLDEKRAEALKRFEERVIETSRPQARLEYERELAGIDAMEARLEQRGALSDQRQRILDSLALYEGILSSLPSDLRGKIGGAAQLASLTTNAAIQKFLEGRIQKMDEVLNSYLKKEYGRLFDKLLERSKPVKGKPGEKPKGKVGNTVHALFARIEEAMTWGETELNAELAANEAVLNDTVNPPSPDTEAQLTLENAMLPMVAGWKKLDAQARASALADATSIYEAGYAKFKLAKLLEAEDREIRRKALISDTGKQGSRAERDSKALTDNSLKGGWKDNFLSLLSFEQVNEYLFGRNSEQARRLVDLERQAAYQKEDAVQGKMDGLDDLFAGLAGSSYEGTVLRYNLAQKSMTVAGESLSEMEGIAATMMWMQEDGRRHMEGRKDGDGNFLHKGVGSDGANWHYDQSYVDEIESKLSPEAKAVRAFLMDSYSKEYDEINPTFVKLNGINLPKNANYSPLTVKPQQASKNEMTDPVTGQAISNTSTTPGSLRTRGTSISEPNFRDAVQTYIAHTKQIKHWLSYAPFSQETTFIRNREFGNAVEAKGGEQALQVLRKWLDFFDTGGNRDASAHLSLNQTMNRIASRAATSALIGRLGVLAIQSTQLGAAMAEMPMGSYVSRLGKLFSGQLGWGAAMKSDYIQRRIKQMPPVVQQAMEGLRATKPNRLKAVVQELGKLIGGADALFTAGTFAMVHDYQKKQALSMGASEADADSYATQAAERSVERIAQPTRAGTRSLYENVSSNPALRVAWAFASEARQKLATALWRVGDPTRSIGEKSRAIGVTWVVGGVMASIIRAAWRDMRDDDDDETFDERNWSLKKLALLSLTGPLQGIPFLGEELEASIYSIGGEYQPGGNLLGSIPKAFKAATRVTDWGDAKPDEIMRDVEAILQGLALGNDTISAASSLSHLARDLFGVAANVAD